MYPLKTNAFFDRIEKEKELRSGPKGVVLLVRDRSTGERMIYRELPGGGDVYRLLLGVDCPQLPHILAVEDTPGGAAVLEEYIPGDTLAFLLENGPLPEDRALAVAGQLCRALETLHGLDIVHRDIKPENVILRGGDAVLIDFDASRLYKREVTTDTRVMGTTGYAAPEQFGFSQTDARADIYSMGVLLNEMVTGKHPATLLAPGRVGRIVERCVEVNIDKRFASAGELRAALEAKDTTPKKKRRLILAAAVAAALALLLGLYAAGVLGGRQRVELPLAGYVTGGESSERVEFTYDADGDGQEETYLFGVVFDLPGRRPGGVDSRLLLEGDTESAVAAPGVWRMLEDGTYEQAFELAALLEDPHTALYCAEQWGPDIPHIYTADPLDGFWNGAIEVEYTGRTAGLWRYVVTAALDGEPLTATATTSIEKTDTLAHTGG